MASARPPRVLCAADKVYRVLLHAYPPAHRRAYGGPMAQLFNDLCRDAVHDGGMPGLIEVWVRALVDTALAAAREHVAEKGNHLVESILALRGLVPALEDVARQMTDAKHFATHLEVDGTVPRLSNEAESTVFDMVREAISNAKAHAQAENVWIAVRCRQDTLEVSVRDDGRGFDTDAVEADSGSRESKQESRMFSRAKTVQGKLSVQSAVGKGTTVRLVAPVAPNLAT